MSRYYVEIGGSPVDEQCAQIGPDQHPDGFANNKLECRAYIAALRAKYGQEPPGCMYRVKVSEHDFGPYAEVVISYNPRDSVSQAYAARAENGVATWHEVGMWPPITWDNGQPRNILRHPSLWFIADNPECRSEPPAEEASE
jgi:hypothetical protein